MERKEERKRRSNRRTEKEIKEVIKEYTQAHEDIDVYKETTISSSFQYLDYTLKQKILTLYEENRDAVDAVISKWSLPDVDETNVGKFVRLRNGKTHSGTFEWGDSADLYTPLLALAYASLLRYIELPKETITSIIRQIF